MNKTDYKFFSKNGFFKQESVKPFKVVQEAEPMPFQFYGKNNGGLNLNPGVLDIEHKNSHATIQLGP